MGEVSGRFFEGSQGRESGGPRGRNKKRILGLRMFQGANLWGGVAPVLVLTPIVIQWQGGAFRLI